MIRVTDQWVQRGVHIRGYRSGGTEKGTDEGVNIRVTDQAVQRGVQIRGYREGYISEVQMRG